MKPTTTAPRDQHAGAGRGRLRPASAALATALLGASVLVSGLVGFVGTGVAEAQTVPSVRTMGGTDLDQTEDVATAPNGDTVAGGYFFLQGTFSGKLPAPAITSAGEGDGFV